MSAPVKARRWTCDRCGVAVGRMDEERVTLPDSWEGSEDGVFCLSCRRGRAAEQAQAAVPDGADGSARAKARKAGLIEFEVRRSPQLTDTIIARACHTSAAVVAAARRRTG